MKIRIAVIVLGIFVLTALAVAGCANSFGTASASFPAPEIGVVADEKLRIIELWPGSAAEAAGLQVGDILLDLTWIPSDAPAYVPEGSDTVHLDAVTVPADGAALVDAGTGDAFVSPILADSVPAIPPPVESYIEKDTVPFTESDRIGALTVYGVPLHLRLMRGDQVLELTIVPTVRSPRPSLASGEIMPTVTPLPPTYYYY